MSLQPLRARLKTGVPLLAPFSIIPSVEIVELLALAGFDGVILDLEHGAHGSEALGPLILAAMALLQPNCRPQINVRTGDITLGSQDAAPRPQVQDSAPLRAAPKRAPGS